MANTRSRASPRWRTLYEAAFLELDPDKLRHRITEAKNAIMDRMEDLDRSEDGAAEELMNALNALRGLRKMADNDGQWQE